MPQSDVTKGILSGRRVLIVEDDPFISLDLEGFLVSGEAVVLGPIATVEGALALLGRDRPDAALLDVNLRGERSTPVAEALVTGEVPFLLVTGYSRSQIDEPILCEVPIIAKPVQEQVLLSALNQLLAGKTT